MAAFQPTARPSTFTTTTLDRPPISLDEILAATRPAETFGTLLDRVADETADRKRAAADEMERLREFRDTLAQTARELGETTAKRKAAGKKVSAPKPPTAKTAPTVKAGATYDPRARIEAALSRESKRRRCIYCGKTDCTAPDAVFE